MGLSWRIGFVLGGLAVLALGLMAGWNRAPEPVFGLAQENNTVRAELEMRLLETPLSPRAIEPLTLARARAAPLDPLSFEARLASELSETLQPERARALAEAALARNGRSRAGRLLRYALLVDAGDWEGALDEFSILHDLLPAQRGALVDALEAQLSDPAARSVIAARVKRDAPGWGRALAGRLSVGEVELATLVDFYRPYPDLQGRLVGGLASGGNLDAAYLSWMVFTDGDERPSGLPFDGRFEGHPAPTPFNWSLDPRGAERLPGGGLYVTYLGTGRPRIAHQLLPLTPGAYTLSLQAEGTYNETAGKLAWSLRCAGGGPVLLRAVMEAGPGALTDQTWDFDVPEAGCGFQELALIGEPGEYPRPIRVTIGAVSITALQGAP